MYGVPLPLSGSPHGLPIQVRGTSSPAAELLHRAPPSGYDLLCLAVANIATSEATLTIEVGTAEDRYLFCKAFKVPPNSPPIPLSPLVLSGGHEVRAFAGTADVLNITGLVYRG